MKRIDWMLLSRIVIVIRLICSMARSIQLSLWVSGESMVFIWTHHVGIDFQQSDNCLKKYLLLSLAATPSQSALTDKTDTSCTHDPPISVTNSFRHAQVPTHDSHTTQSPLQSFRFDELMECRMFCFQQLLTPKHIKMRVNWTCRTRWRWKQKHEKKNIEWLSGCGNMRVMFV